MLLGRPVDLMFLGSSKGGIFEVFFLFVLFVLLLSIGFKGLGS